MSLSERFFITCFPYSARWLKKHILLNAFAYIPVGHAYLCVKEGGNPASCAINYLAHITIQALFSLVWQNCYIFFHIFITLSISYYYGINSPLYSRSFFITSSA